MIIDVHTHFMTPKQASWANTLFFSAGAYGNAPPEVTDADLDQVIASHLRTMDAYGIDVQIISPSPVNLNHGRKTQNVHWWITHYNDTLARIVARRPDKFVGVGGLPQASAQQPKDWLPEMARCKDLGFVGVLVNPDPSEGTAHTPNLADEYWYPVWEKLCELDMVGHIHLSCCQNHRAHFHEYYAMEETLAVTALARSRVFEDFPDLRLLIPHGGGGVPIHFGRFSVLHQGAYPRSFEAGVRQMYYDLSVWGSQKALELVIDSYGVDRCLFATEAPGSGTGPHPVTGRMQDDIRPLIEAIPYLTDEDRQAIFEGNARKFFRLDRVPALGRPLAAAE